MVHIPAPPTNPADILSEIFGWFCGVRDRRIAEMLAAFKYANQASGPLATSSSRILPKRLFDTPKNLIQSQNVHVELGGKNRGTLRPSRNALA